jgi:hypothetical protein
MNKFKKYYENIFIAECEQEYSKGEIITLETKYGKEAQCEVYNLVGQAKGLFYYSIVRIDQESYAKRKAEKYEAAAIRSEAKSIEWYEKSKEGIEFLSLAEPIKVGHHSEGRHRALIERNWKRMSNSVTEADKAKEQQQKAEYWKSRENEINLSVPESVEYYEHKLEEAKKYHTGLKNGSIPRQHSYDVQYANKKVKELQKKCEIAIKLWGSK